METRETGRDALVTLFGTIAGDGQILQSVVGHKVTAADIEGKTPLLSVTSAGSLRQMYTFDGTRPSFDYQIDVWVWLGDGSTWTAANAEDKIDTIEQSIATIVENNQRTTNWQALDYADASAVADVVFDGVPYIRETIVLRAEVMK